MDRGTILSTTESLCPHCLKKIPANRVAYGEEVYLEKKCPEHGEFRVLLWRGNPDWQSWVRPKVRAKPKVCLTEVDQGCPFDCGLCAKHRQHTCTALLEVTQRCNLKCTFCFADAGKAMDSDPDLPTIQGLFEKILISGGPCNIQLSGGEPTVRDDLPEIVALGRSLGFKFIQLNSNGRRLAGEPQFAEQLAKAGLSSVFLQFDGTEDKIHRQLRGEALLQEKIRAIENCGRYNIGVILVPTLVPGVNTDNIGDIIKFAVKMSPTVRGVHFQPVSYFGRYPEQPADANRITIPQVITAIEEQTGGLVRGENFRPPGCENALCSFHGNFIIGPEGNLKPLSQPNNSCCTPEKAEIGAAKTRSFVARNWSAANLENPLKVARDQVLDSWDDLLDRIRTYSFTISGMAFQDVWNLDLKRLRDCCIHVVSPQGKLVPFCAYNLTDSRGNSLYRNRR